MATQHRRAGKRLLAPFLEYDSDPYIVISDDGRLYWFQDAYIISDRFPYSESVVSGGVEALQLHS
ncbi:MAG: UPF0182 family protein [Caldilineaceae bacterium]